MKVLMINTLYEPYVLGGAEKSTKLLADELVKKGHEVVVLSTAKETKIADIGKIKSYYVSIPNIFWRYEAAKQSIFRRALWRLIDIYNPFVFKVKNIIQKEQPDIIHTNNIAGFSVALLSLIRKLKIPNVHTLRDHYMLCKSNRMLKGQTICKKQCATCKLYTLNKKIISNKIEAVVGISNYILNVHLENGYFYNAQIKEVIHNGITINNEFQNEKANMQVKKKTLTFGFLGQLHPVKGIEQLIKLFDFDDAELIVAGKEFNAGYLTQLKALGNSKTKFVGFIPSSDFFREIDVLIHPALWREPFCRVIIEAYAYGVPVIASSNGGLPEIIEHKKTGMIFDSNDFNNLHRRIEEVINAPWMIQQMSKNCFSKAHEFRNDLLTNKYIDVYLKTIANYEKTG